MQRAGVNLADMATCEISKCLVIIIATTIDHFVRLRQIASKSPYYVITIHFTS